MKNIEESVNMYIMEKNIETAKDGGEIETIFQTQLTTTDIEELPVELKQEILYVRDKINNSVEIKASASDYDVTEFSEDDLFFVDSSVAEGKEKAYVYDEQSKSIFKAKPTIISGKSMFGHDYGKIIGVQGLLSTSNQSIPTIKETLLLESNIKVGDFVSYEANGYVDWQICTISADSVYIISTGIVKTANVRGTYNYNKGDVITAIDGRDASGYLNNKYAQSVTIPTRGIIPGSLSNIGVAYWLGGRVNDSRYTIMPYVDETGTYKTIRIHDDISGHSESLTLGIRPYVRLIDDIEVLGKTEDGKWNLIPKE